MAATPFPTVVIAFRRGNATLRYRRRVALKYRRGGETSLRVRGSQAGTAEIEAAAAAL